MMKITDAGGLLSCVTFCISFEDMIRCLDLMIWRRSQRDNQAKRTINRKSIAVRGIDGFGGFER